MHSSVVLVLTKAGMDMRDSLPPQYTTSLSAFTRSADLYKIGRKERGLARFLSILINN